MTPHTGFIDANAEAAPDAAAPAICTNPYFEPVTFAAIPQETTFTADPISPAWLPEFPDYPY